ncbi:MAG: LamG domain-containing protein [Verrucomicrobiae bacterium]|nr:LamG domain-containing protein [Verrucomicrobiae bacterium]NNJ42894.1 hypothetical protein [Akkermansiaceae bacterium]
MKNIPNLFTFLLLALSMVLTGLSLAETAAYHPAQARKEIYELRITQADSLYADQLEVLARQYTSALDGTAALLQKQGQLEGLLAVKAELKRFNETETVPAKNSDGTHASVLKLRTIYNQSRAKADAQRGQSMTKLTQSYLADLGALQKKLTQDGELEQALRVKTEVTKAQKFMASLPAGQARGHSAVPPQPSNPNVDRDRHAAAPLILAWDRNRPDVLLGPNRRAASGCQLSEQGGNGIAKDGSLTMVGGKTLIEGLNRKLLSACKLSKQWSLALDFETSSLQQTGPARMFSFSLNGYMRNFSLCQENDQLVLRLRTTQTGDNGTKPEVKLGKIQQGKTHRIVITYQPGKLAFYMDGKSIPVKQISGDFSNWKEYQLVLGNEWKEDRAWKGQFFRFELYSVALAAREALARTR